MALPAKNPDLHGNVPDKSDVALVLIDVINDMEWQDGEKLFKYALPMAKHIKALKARAKQAKIPVIYANDNFGKWRSDFRALVEHCLHDDVRGKPIAELLQPDEDDYFVLKPKLSAFYSTTLELLLDYLGTRTLILTGVAGNLCVLYSAIDASLRDYQLVIPSDCIASNTRTANERALEHMKTNLHAHITPSTHFALSKLKRQAKKDA
jgi:nicotinamidase-related amidase